MKCFKFLLGITALFCLSGCFSDFVRKEELQVLETSLTKRLNTLNYDLNITKGAVNENREAIEILQQQVDEVNKHLGLIRENIDKVGGIENKFNSKLKNMMEEVVRENERLIKEINKTRGASDSGEKGGSSKPKTEYKGPGYTYTVTIGDSLSKIAKKTHVRLEDLLSANNIDNPDSLYMGQEIIIPSDKPATEEK